MAGLALDGGAIDTVRKSLRDMARAQKIVDATARLAAMNLYLHGIGGVNA